MASLTLIFTRSVEMKSRYQTNDMQFLLMPCKHWMPLIVSHYDVIKWKHFPHYRPFVREIHPSPVDPPYKGTVTWIIDISLLSVWTEYWTNTRLTTSSNRHDGHLTSPQWIMFCMTILYPEHLQEFHLLVVYRMFIVGRPLLYYAKRILFPQLHLLWHAINRDEIWKFKYKTSVIVCLHDEGPQWTHRLGPDCTNKSDFTWTS